MSASEAAWTGTALVPPRAGDAVAERSASRTGLPAAEPVAGERSGTGPRLAVTSVCSIRKSVKDCGPKPQEFLALTIETQIRSIYGSSRVPGRDYLREHYWARLAVRLA